MAILLLIYAALGYWAVGKTIWANKTIVYNSGSALFIQRTVYGFFLGWILIPIALIKMFLTK